MMRQRVFLQRNRPPPSSLPSSCPFQVCESSKQQLVAEACGRIESENAVNLKLEDSPDMPQCRMLEEPQAQTETSSLREEVARQRLDCKEGPPTAMSL